MTTPKLKHCLLFCAIAYVMRVTPLEAQTIESVGSRALGMGGAFVAVASDSSATWWNPAGLGAGPFLDMALARAVTEARRTPTAQRDTATWFALGTPPFGFSYYRLRITEIQPDAAPPNPTVTESGSRQIGVRSVAVDQFGATLVQTLLPGVHAGATLKYMRGTVRAGLEDSAADAAALLDRGDALDGGDRDRAFGVDIGLIAVGGPIRAGLLVRNAVESELVGGAGAEAITARFERALRVGVAYDAEGSGGPPLVVAVDADVSTAATASGDRRNVAIGVERWLFGERLGVRGGARFNTVGAKTRAATAGMSAAVRAGLFLDAHVVRGGDEDDRGWGIAARVSF